MPPPVDLQAVTASSLLQHLGTNAPSLSLSLGGTVDVGDAQIVTIGVGGTIPASSAGVFTMLTAFGANAGIVTGPPITIGTDGTIATGLVVGQNFSVAADFVSDGTIEVSLTNNSTADLPLGVFLIGFQISP